MVTKRGRRWIQRGVTATIVVLVLSVALAAWFTSEMIETDLLTSSGEPPSADPGDAGLGFAPLELPGPLGNYPAWLVAAADGAEDDTWMVFVHDGAGNREQALDLLPTVAAHGLTSLVITYRGDAAAPASEGGHHTLGGDEWEDLEAAVQYAIGSGARDVVLVGHGSGGAIVLTFLRRSEWAGRVAGVVLDSAYLDPGSMVDDRTGADNVPGFLAGWGKALANFRFGVDWAALDQVAASDEFAVSILLIHGAADQTVPIRLADAFAEARPDLVRYLRLEGVGHIGGFAADPDRYAGALGHFLRRVAVGPSETPEIIPETGVE